jgi:diketogulonate reductase-like aldo/keto reductase
MLNNGQPVPQLGFGVFLVKPEDTVDAVTTALEAGYRHIDTAEMYGNEREVGQAIAKSGLSRDDVFVTSKLTRGGELLADPEVTRISKATGKTPAQVVLRWHIERGDIVFPKSVTPARIRENFDIFDFELSGDDVAAISSLNRDQRSGPDPDTFPG